MLTYVLNSKVIPQDNTFDFDTMVSITRLNALRHSLNHLCMLTFARRHNQRIYLFPAQHSRLPSPRHLSLEDVFRQQDEGVAIPSPGLFMYTPGMPCMILANMNSALGLVNGSRGIASGIILEPNSKSKFPATETVV